MTKASITHYISIIHSFAIILIAALCAGASAHALDLGSYAADSRLSSGTWVKISVKEDGMYAIPESSLRNMGFSDARNVKVYGYGGRRLPELLDATTYIDDLPQTPSVWVDGKGLVFYGQGVWWHEPSTQRQTFVNQTVELTEGSDDTMLDTQYDTAHEPLTNPFSTVGYYFLSENSDPRLEPATTARPGATSPVTTFCHTEWHKQELVSPGQCGHQLVGEDFRYTTSQEFRISLPGMAAGHPVYFESSFIANSPYTSTVSYTVNGKQLPTISTDRTAGNSDSHTHGTEARSRRILKGVNAERLTVGIKFNAGGSLSLANLNFLSATYRRSLDMGTLSGIPFTLDSSERAVALSGASAESVVWDVTDPLAVQRVNTSLSSNTISWTADYNTPRTYIAWNPSQTFKTPAVAGRVAAQNLHAIPTTDMVIVAFPEWQTQAERLADFHRSSKTDSLSVSVVAPEAIYNEFSSGKPDVMAFRKFFKMLYDRGTAEGHPLRYALIMSRVTFDNRRITQQISNLSYPTTAAWFTDFGLSDNSAYTTDDVMAFLEDGSGRDKGRDRLSIALGRIPVTSASNAKDIVDKIINYSTSSPKGNWRNNVLTLADDQDNAIHMEQAERQQNLMRASDGGSELFFKKLYVDQYDVVSGVCKQGRTEFYRMLDEGVMWWNYIGHASTSALTAEGIVTYSDLNSLYLRHLPVVYAATCNFLRWDAPDMSGAELLFMNPNGGVSAAISATRPVYISDNGYLSESLGRYAFSRGDDGRLHTIGDIYTQMKNNFTINGTVAGNTNKLRYVLMGDPAMRLAMPSSRVVLDRVNGQPFVGPDDPGEPTTLMARQQVKIEGHIEDPTGALDTSFNGIVSSMLYDAEKSYTTQGHGDSKKLSYDQQGGRLFIGNDSVSAGNFTLNISMPAEVADNFRPAALSLFAYADNGSEAVGVNRNFYVYGTDPDAIPDSVPPVIEQCYLNNPSFRDGGTVNPSPMLIARISDDRAINLSTAGIGHQMLITLDEGDRNFTDVAQYYTPNSDGSPGGTIAYPFEELTEGPHSLRLRVWDTGPNSAECSLNFVVAKDIAPVLYDVYTDTNPASEYANFYVSHDRPDQSLTVTIEVYDLLGRRVWSATQTARSDLFTSVPVVWNLTDQAGRRVNRGIYLYRATISDDNSGGKTATASRKLAVTAQ